MKVNINIGRKEEVSRSYIKTLFQAMSIAQDSLMCEKNNRLYDFLYMQNEA